MSIALFVNFSAFSDQSLLKGQDSLNVLEGISWKVVHYLHQNRPSKHSYVICKTMQKQKYSLHQAFKVKEPSFDCALDTPPEEGWNSDALWAAVVFHI